jgi:2-desacetyl-2-hydroxyethyl bacteriochlorophyllide A dehydrogenase
LEADQKMRAVVLNRGQVLVREDLPEPEPQEGQVLVRVHACGICGSDLHFAKHGPDMLKFAEEVEGFDQGGAGEDIDLERDVYMGHEFAAEVLAAGPRTDTFKPGTMVTSVPLLATAAGVKPIVYSNELLGGFGEQMLLTATLLEAVPNGLAPQHAALTEPMAVGLHAVNRSGIEAGQGALVLGCGPVGLAIISALARRGAAPIVAAEYSPPRRLLAQAMGAHEVVDPRAEPLWNGFGTVRAMRPSVVFEAIGVPGVINEIMRCTPPGSRIVVAGACMEPDAMRPMFGLSKELEIRFATAYDVAEFAECLGAIAAGEIDVTPLITAEIGLGDVPAAFDALADPNAHCKIMVRP